MPATYRVATCLEAAKRSHGQGAGAREVAISGEMNTFPRLHKASVFQGQTGHDRVGIMELKDVNVGSLYACLMEGLLR